MFKFNLFLFIFIMFAILLHLNLSTLYFNYAWVYSLKVQNKYASFIKHIHIIFKLYL